MGVPSVFQVAPPSALHRKSESPISPPAVTHETQSAPATPGRATTFQTTRALGAVAGACQLRASSSLTRTLPGSAVP